MIIRKKKQRFTLWKITRSDNSKKETKIYKDLIYEKLLGVIIRKKKQRFTLWKITRSDNSKKKQRFTLWKITRSDNSKKETKIYFMKNYSEW